MLYYRADSGRRESKPRVLQRREKRIASEVYGGWNVTVREATVGLTVKKKQFRVSLEHRDLKVSKLLTGFWSSDRALDAGRRWIDQDKQHKHIRRMKRIVSNRKDDRPLHE